MNFEKFIRRINFRKRYYLRKIYLSKLPTITEKQAYLELLQIELLWREAKWAKKWLDVLQKEIDVIEEQRRNQRLNVLNEIQEFYSLSSLSLNSSSSSSN